MTSINATVKTTFQNSVASYHILLVQYNVIMTQWSQPGGNSACLNADW